MAIFFGRKQVIWPAFFREGITHLWRSFMDDVAYTLTDRQRSFVILNLLSFSFIECTTKKYDYLYIV